MMAWHADAGRIDPGSLATALRKAVGRAGPPGELLPRHLPRWRQLLTPSWLAAWLSGLPVEAAPAADWRLFEVGCGGAASFMQAHIPCAGYLDTHQLEGGAVWNKVSDEELLRLLLGNGIRHDTTVLLYGRNTLCAARAAHLMLYAGVKDVRLLDGGYAAWTDAGYPVIAGEPPTPPAASDFGALFPGRAEYAVDMQQAQDLMRRNDGALVSIRTWAEHTGKTSGYSYIAPKGDIPGARWGRAGRDGDVNCMSAFQRPDGTMKPPCEIQAIWKDAGVHAWQRTAFYCGTGWRASLAFFYAWLMNWERISVYDGGWFEWSSLTGHPVAAGPCETYSSA
jgi:thiosulfate/3-mercaptopyruvate sulfurtransferase